MKVRWKQFVKVFEYAPAPYYIQWVVWCWRKPIYIGLPLIFLAYIVIIIDAFYGLTWILLNWGRRER